MKRLALLFLPLTAFAAAPAADWAPNLTTTIAWHGNITNGGAVWDRIGTLEVGADILSSSRRELSRTDALHTSLHLAGSWFPRFSGINRGALGALVDWQHSFGVDSFAPVFTVEAGGDGVLAGESERRGVVGHVTLKLSKRFGDAWRLALYQRFEQYNASKAVFDSTSSETALEISRDLNEDTRFTLTGRWREGDVVTYAQYDRPDLTAAAHTMAPSSTFKRPMIAYAANARTIGGRAALVHATSENAATILAYDYSSTKEGAVQFENHVISLSIVHQY